MKPLTGVTVLELSTMVTASLATMMLAEQGARAIKVEPVDIGDPMRFLGTMKGGMSGLFANCNRGKESVRINLKHAAGQAFIRRLVPQVDVLIHNYRPGVMDGLNLGSQALRAINPRLVFVAVSGFGTDGPYGDAPAYDPIIQAQAGFAAAQGRERPEFIRNLMCDKITAYTACQAATAALFERSRTGVGQHIDVAMIEAGLSFLFPDGFMNDTVLDADAIQQPLLADLVHAPTVTADGLITYAAGSERQRLGVVLALGLEGLLADERFNSEEKMFANRTLFKALLDEAFAQLPTAVAIARLAAHDVPCSRLLTRAEVLAHPQLAHNGTFGIVDHPAMGTLRVMHPPARFHGAQLPPGSHAPVHGQHTVALLAEVGFSAAEIRALAAAGTIADAG